MFIANYLPKAVLETTGRSMLLVQKNSPTILFASGVIGAVASTVLACKSTLKLEAVLVDAQKTMELIDTVMATEDAYSDKDRAKDKALLRVKTAVTVTKLYAPAIGVGLISVAALTGSHYIMSSRQTALMAAYAALDRGYREFQARVQDELGVDRAEQLRVGSISVKEKDEDGKTVKVSKRDPGNGYSPYARLFDQHTSSEWNEVHDYNIMALSAKQSWANNMLSMQGHLFLNDVYKMLGLEPTSEGQLVGWIKGSKNGDDFVDFGIFGDRSERVRNFMLGDEGAIWLDFNVDGVVYNEI